MYEEKEVNVQALRKDKSMTDELSLESLLEKGSGEFGAVLGPQAAARFLIFKDLLKEWNTKINLTAIEEDRDIIVKHFIDSLSILPYIKNEETRIIDVGTGAGFPGIPLKIVLDKVKVTLLDSLDKRVKFLDEVIARLELRGVETVHGRAEDFGAKQGYREAYDIATARAVASLPVLLEYCLPFVRSGGFFIAMKGSSTDEVESSKKALEILGGKIEEIREFVLPFSDMKRNIIIVKKLRQTPPKYPRKAGKPSKEPL